LFRITHSTPPRRRAVKRRTARKRERGDTDLERRRDGEAESKDANSYSNMTRY